MQIEEARTVRHSLDWCLEQDRHMHHFVRQALHKHQLRETAQHTLHCLYNFSALINEYANIYFNNDHKHTLHCLYLSL